MLVFSIRAKWLRGATVARLTTDQKLACSNHVGVNFSHTMKINHVLFRGVLIVRSLPCIPEIEYHN